MPLFHAQNLVMHAFQISVLRCFITGTIRNVFINIQCSTSAMMKEGLYNICKFLQVPSSPCFTLFCFMLRGILYRGKKCVLVFP